MTTTGRAKGGVARAAKLSPERRSEIAKQAARTRHSSKQVRKPTVASLSKRIDACKARIGAERDKLRDLIDDATEIESNCDEAIEDLDSAVDKLSRYL
jgi:hypothetical protein